MVQPKGASSTKLSLRLALCLAVIGSSLLACLGDPHQFSGDMTCKDCKTDLPLSVKHVNTLGKTEGIDVKIDTRRAPPSSSSCGHSPACLLLLPLILIELVFPNKLDHITITKDEKRWIEGVWIHKGHLLNATVIRGDAYARFTRQNVPCSGDVEIIQSEAGTMDKAGAFQAAAQFTSFEWVESYVLAEMKRKDIDTERKACLASSLIHQRKRTRLNGENKQEASEAVDQLTDKLFAGQENDAMYLSMLKRDCEAGWYAAASLIKQKAKALKSFEAKRATLECLLTRDTSEAYVGGAQPFRARSAVPQEALLADFAGETADLECTKGSQFKNLSVNTLSRLALFYPLIRSALEKSAKQCKLGEAEIIYKQLWGGGADVAQIKAAINSVIDEPVALRYWFDLLSAQRSPVYRKLVYEFLKSQKATSESIRILLLWGQSVQSLAEQQALLTALTTDKRTPLDAFRLVYLLARHSGQGRSKASLLANAKALIKDVSPSTRIYIHSLLALLGERKYTEPLLKAVMPRGFMLQDLDDFCGRQAGKSLWRGLKTLAKRKLPSASTERFMDILLCGRSGDSETLSASELFFQSADEQFREPSDIAAWALVHYNCGGRLKTECSSRLLDFERQTYVEPSQNKDLCRDFVASTRPKLLSGPNPKFSSVDIPCDLPQPLPLYWTLTTTQTMRWSDYGLRNWLEKREAARGMALPN